MHSHDTYNLQQSHDPDANIQQIPEIVVRCRRRCAVTLNLRIFGVALAVATGLVTDPGPIRVCKFDKENKRLAI